jgi:hypothetical protein
VKEPLNPYEARKLLSSILVKGRVVESRHFRIRLKHHGMTMLDAQAIMQRGAIYEPCEFKDGSYRYRFHLQKVGTVVVAFGSEEEAHLVTVWKK